MQQHQEPPPPPPSSSSSSSSASHRLLHPLPPSASSSLRKIHVVYFLCRSSGHLEQPHLLEVSIPSNQGLFLKDVKSRLSAIRGSKLPSSFAWSYKRSYKNEYVWQDLCDDDLIFPAHGCDYVLKGSEILTENNGSAPNTDGDGIKSHQKQRADSVEHVAGIDPQPKRDLHPQQLAANPNTGLANSSTTSVNPAARVAAHPVCMSEIGTDAATQTEADNQNGSHEEEEAHRLEQIQQRSTSATELDIKADMPSPPSSSSTMSSSPYNLCVKNAEAKAEESDCNKVMVRRSSKVDIADRDKEIRVVGCGTNSEEDEEEEAAEEEEEEEDDEDDAGYRSVSNLMKQHTAVGSRSDKCDSIANSTTQFRSSNTEKNSNQTHLLHELLHQSPSSTPTSSTSSQKSRRSSHHNNNNYHYGDHPPSSSSMKQQCIQSATLSLLQFMSCGRSDIKDQILPMSLYRLRSCKSSASVSDDVVDDEASIPDSSSGVANHAAELQKDVYRSYDGQNHRAAPNWLKIGGSKSSCTKLGSAANQRVNGGLGETPSVPIKDDIAVPDSVGMGELNDDPNNHQQHNRHRHIQSDPAMFSAAPQSEMNNPNLNNSREADNRLQVNKNQAAAMASREASSTGNTSLHSRRLSSEAMNYMWKSSPLKLGSSCKELAIAAGANHSSNLLMQRSSGELLHCNYICNGSKSSCSPLFVPGKQYINAGVQLELLSKPCYSINHHVANPPLHAHPNPRINDLEAPNHKPNSVSSSSSCPNAVKFMKSGDAADAERI